MNYNSNITIKMKKGIYSVATMALLFASLMCSCNNEKNPFVGYEKANSGLYYKFYTKNEGEKPQQGDLLEVVFSCTVNDTNVIIPTTPNVFRLEAPLFSGDIFEAMSMMHKGDSASFIVDIDSTFKTFFGRPSLPEEFNVNDVMRFEMRLDDFYPESEYWTRMAMKVKEMNDERAANLKAEHPEETAAAAEALSNYLAKNNVTVEPTESGLYYVVIQEGNGEKPHVGKSVTMHYTGKLLDGTVFDSSVERDQPFVFPLGVGRVIPGWDEGVQLMSKGEKGIFYIPYYLAYGERDMGEIPAFSNLVFEVELVDFE